MKVLLLSCALITLVMCEPPAPKYHYLPRPSGGRGHNGVNFGAPNLRSQFNGLPGSNIGTPTQSFGFPGQNRGIPSQSYGPPGQNQQHANNIDIRNQVYGAPANQIATSGRLNGIPKHSYSISPSQNNAVPGQSYGISSQSNAIPIQTYVISSQNNAIPSPSYEVTSQNPDIPSQLYEVASHESNMPSQSDGVPSQNLFIPNQDNGVSSQNPTTISELYGASNQNFENLSQSYDVPNQNPTVPSQSTEYQAVPSQSYGMPSQNVAILSQSYEAPSQNTGMPSRSHGVHSPNAVITSQYSGQYFGVPSQNPAIPSQSLEAPNQNLITPSQVYGIPSHSNGGRINGHSFYKRPSSSLNNVRRPTLTYGVPSAVIRSPSSPILGNPHSGNAYLTQSENLGNGGYKNVRGRNGKNVDLSEPANYEFEYMIKDPPAGNDFGRKEVRQGSAIKGRYYVLLPDGRRQIVEYEADKAGYRPTIRYEGEANINTNGNVGNAPQKDEVQNGKLSSYDSNSGYRY